MDHSTFTAKTKIHSGLSSAQFDCVAVFDPGSSQSFITPNAREHMVRSGAATTICETQTPPRSWDGFGKSPPLQTSPTVRLSIRFVHDDQPTALSLLVVRPLASYLFVTCLLPVGCIVLTSFRLAVLELRE